MLVSRPLGRNIRTDRVYKDCPIVVCGKTMCAGLVELPMHNVHVIVGMKWLHSFYACMDCCNRVVRYHFSNKKELVWEG